MPGLGVVIVNYQAQLQVCRCLASLKQCCRGDLRYIVVDNSPESEVELIARTHPDIVAIVPGGAKSGDGLPPRWRRRGPAGAMPLGLRHADQGRGDPGAGNDG